MDKKSVEKTTDALRFVPLSIMLASTAIVFQQAYSLRMEMIIEDEDLTSIFQWIHPAAYVAITLGYTVSVIAALPVLLRSRNEQ